MTIFPLPASSRLKSKAEKSGESVTGNSISTLNWVGEAVSVKLPKLTRGRVLGKY